IGYRPEVIRAPVGTTAELIVFLRRRQRVSMPPTLSGRDPMADSQSLIAEHLAAVEDRLSAVCRRSGRSRAEVTLVAVTKTVSVESATLLPGLGVHDLGESRPQELWRKAAAVPLVRWHLIGHLQRNKIERTLPLASCIHSVDSLRLLRALETAAE